MNSNKIAIIGGGPAGLTALKSALDDGLQATLFEQSNSIGGQWNQQGEHSGAWESLHTNSSKFVTLFSDLLYRDDVQLYPGHWEVRQYLDDYKDHFKLDPHINLNTRVENISRLTDGNWSVTYTANGGSCKQEIFTHVIITSGRFNIPHMPNIPGVDRFQGTKRHAKNYKKNSDFTGRSVLVVGNSISGLEIASDLSTNESITVISSGRKPKYILKKIINGNPVDHMLFTRFRNFAAQAFTPAVNAENFKQFVLKTCGNPADFGGLKPSENIFEAGISACQNYLDQVQKKKILVKGAINHFTENSVVFDDGTGIEIDDVIFATGYDISLPFFNDELLSIINTGDQHLDLYKYTFHPDLPNMAFIGLYIQIGPKFPSFELQARWITGCWSGHIQLPNREEMLTGIEVFRQSKKIRDAAMAQEMIILFAQAAGVEPDLHHYPELTGSLIFGPLIPSQFRLQGHGSKENAKQIYLSQNANITNKLSELAPQQLAELEAVAQILKQNYSLQKLMEEVRS